MLVAPWVKYGHDYYTIVCKCRLYISLEKCDTLIIAHQYQGATYRPQHVCEVALEEPFHSFILHDLLPTVHSSPESVESRLSVHLFGLKCVLLVHLLLLPAHHHEPPPHCVEGVGHCN